MLEAAGRISDQGTATSLPPLEELLEPSEPLVPLEPVEPVEEELLEPLDSTEMMAKSTLPEFGLMITSLMVPRFESPEVPLSGALISLVAWISCPPRPVALSELELEPCLLLRSVWLPLLPEELCLELDPDRPEELELSDELWACATPTKPATQRTVRAIERFFIVAFLY